MLRTLIKNKIVTKNPTNTPWVVCYLSILCKFPIQMILSFRIDTALKLKNLCTIMLVDQRGDPDTCVKIKYKNIIIIGKFISINHITKHG